MIEINGNKYEVMGGITTAQQFDYARNVLYEFTKAYNQAIKDDVNSVFLSFKSAKELNGFLSVILVPEGKQWNMDIAKETEEHLNNNMIDPEVFEVVVQDFFERNQKWAGFSPMLRALQQRTMEAIAQKMVGSSNSLNEVLKTLSASTK
jgi:hypothetical protein